MKEPIITIPRARESWIKGLIEMGILEVAENGIFCKEKGPSAGKQKGPKN